MKVKPQINTYSVIMRAVEEGVGIGLHRADKHADDPLTARQRERVRHQVEIEIANALSEVIKFD